MDANGAISAQANSNGPTAPNTPDSTVHCPWRACSITFPPGATRIFHDHLNQHMTDILEAGPSYGKCKWPECHAHTTMDMELHIQRVHIFPLVCAFAVASEEADGDFLGQLTKKLGDLAGANTCIWPKCSSKVLFKWPSSLRTHINNVHLYPLVCTFPRCSHTSAFGKQHDLDRHMSTIHNPTGAHTCPVETCDRNINGFSRKDKLMKHMREAHVNFKCPLNHCVVTVVENQTESHIQEAHGDYECGFGACGNAAASRFTRDSVNRHLRRVHGLDYDDLLRMFLGIRSTDRKARPTDRMGRKARECPTCLHQQAQHV
jgi:hypothetical protein